MKSIRHVLAGSALAAGALVTAAGFSIANADDAPAAAAAESGPHSHDRGPEGIYGRLNLSPQQEASIKAIRTAAKPQMQSMHARQEASHLKLLQTTPDDPNYGSIVAEVAQTNATLASQRTTRDAELKAQMYAVLTPTQKTQLAALQAQWAASPHHDRWHRRGGPTAEPAPAPAT